jgi:hypothetical protein
MPAVLIVIKKLHYTLSLICYGLYVTIYSSEKAARR